MSGDINEAKYDPADDDLVATDKDKASAKLNIVMQLRKSMDVRGNMAIKFADGKSQKIPMNIMKIALDKFAKVRKLDSKVKMQDAMSKSYKDMILTLKTFKETVWSNSLGREVLDEAAKVLATGGKGQYKAVTKNGSVSIMFKGKAIATGDFDRGADAFFLSWKDMQKGKKNSRPEGTAFDTAQDMVDFFAKKKITESLEEATATTKQKKALASLMTKALGGKKSKPGYTSSIASNGDFVAYDGGMRIQGRIKKGDFTNPMTEETMTESYGSMNASVDKVKVQKQIDQAEKYLKTFFGNTSSVKTKKFAIQKKIEKLKAQLKEEALLDHELMINEAMGNWTVSVVKPVNKLKKGDEVTIKARSAFEAINKAIKSWKDPALKGAPSSHFKIVKEEVESIEEVIERHIEEGFSQREIKMAIGIASDKRYAGVNMTGATKAIEKLKKGLSSQPQVMAVLKRQNEELELDEGKDLTYTVVHARKGKVVVTAPTSYAAAQKAAKQWKLKSTGGVDAYLMKEETLEEAPSYKLYHSTFSAAVQEAIAVAKKQGYDVDEDDWSNKVATGPKKPSKDKTNRYSIKLEKGGKPTRKFLQIQVYNMGSKYELNCYVQ